MPGAGKLNERVILQRRLEDDNGDRLGRYATVCERPCQIVYLRGGEQVLQQRLQGVQPVAITMRRDSETREVTNAWRAILKSDPTQIFEGEAVAPNRDDPRAFIDFLGTAKRAGGV